VVGATLEVQNSELGKEGEKVEGGRGFVFFFFLGNTRVVKRLQMLE
jgi:hypothetical protein